MILGDEEQGGGRVQKLTSEAKLIPSKSQVARGGGSRPMVGFKIGLARSIMVEAYDRL